MRKAGVFKGICICVAICAIGIFAYLAYFSRLNNYATDSVYVSLSETALQQNFNIKQELSPDIRILSDLAANLGENSDDLTKSTDLQAETILKTHFEAFNYYDVNGACITSFGYPVDPPNSDSLSDTNADSAISYSMTADRPDIFLMSIPVHDKNGQRLGTLIGAHNIEQLRDALLPFLHNNGVTYISNKSGDLIVSSLSESTETEQEQSDGNFWDHLTQSEYEGYDTAAEMKDNMRKCQSGNMIYRSDGQKLYAHYTPVGISDWYIFTVVANKTVVQQLDLVLSSALVLTIIMISTFAILIFYIFRQQRRHNVRLERAAYYDELCNCPNLPRFKLTAQHFIDQHREEKFAMIKLDIDRFKLVNQILGVELGDVILKNLAMELTVSADHDECRFARAHDDEFYVLQRYRDEAELATVRRRFYEGFISRMGTDFHYHIQFVLGSYYMDSGNKNNIAEAIEKANIAHQKAKTLGKEICIYDETFRKDALRKKKVEDRMELALADQEFLVYFQPQYDLHKNTVIGAEALVRWNIGNDERIYPDEFIPLFEENNFIIQLDMYMFEHVCRIIRSWIDDGLTPFNISVNFARNHLANINFVEELCVIADRYQIPHHLLEVELTERVIAQGESLSLKISENLHQKGFTLAMDDFGTGYSSLGLLKNTPVDVIKIDKSFFDKADDQPRTKAVLCNVLRLAKDLDAYTIAEGVETEATAKLLRDLGCDAIQGYYYGHPIPEAAFRATLTKGDC